MLSYSTLQNTKNAIQCAFEVIGEKTYHKMQNLKLILKKYIRVYS